MFRLSFPIFLPPPGFGYDFPLFFLRRKGDKAPFGYLSRPGNSGKVQKCQESCGEKNCLKCDWFGVAISPIFDKAKTSGNLTLGHFATTFLPTYLLGFFSEKTLRRVVRGVDVIVTQGCPRGVRWCSGEVMGILFIKFPHHLHDTSLRVPV